MANQSLFGSAALPQADTVNEAGGAAYSLGPKHALAQLASTGCFNGTCYTSDKDQLEAYMAQVALVDDNDFLAKLCIYSREKAHMKDMPAALLCVLAKRNRRLFEYAFNRTVVNGKILKSFFQMIRSGLFGNKTFSGCVKRVVQKWFNSVSVNVLVNSSIGDKPSIRDVLRLVRPKPKDNERRAIFGWLTESSESKWLPATPVNLPLSIKCLRLYRKAESEEDQIKWLIGTDARWDLLATDAKGPRVWKELAWKMGHQALRMNLNTLLRHGVLEYQDVVNYVAARISYPEEIQKSKQFPYQYLAAYLNADENIPAKIRSALSTAAEIACGNIPKFTKPVLIGLDVSGSMRYPVTGSRGSGTSKVRCVDVASLFASAVFRSNPDSTVICFDDRAYKANLDAGNTILSLAKELSSIGGGGTECSIPFRVVNNGLYQKAYAAVILISDNQSWIRDGYGSTTTVQEWNRFKVTMKHLGSRPKLVCIDICPNETVQAPDDKDVLNVGGFSDSVFHIANSFVEDNQSNFLQEINSIMLGELT